jgi:hypothetical protein
MMGCDIKRCVEKENNTMYNVVVLRKLSPLVVKAGSMPCVGKST